MKPKLQAVPDCRDHAHRLIAEQRDEEALRVRRVETVGVVQARVPPFRGRPVDADIEFAARQGPDSEDIHDYVLGGRSRVWRSSGYMIWFTVPPSTRMAAPVVALARGLHR